MTKKRPCSCECVRLGQPFDIGRDCRRCWLYHHDAAYNLAWGGDGRVRAVIGVPRTPLPCLHLGGETGERRHCSSCSGRVEVKLRACARHGSCTTHKPLTGVACCQGCGDFQPDTFALVAPWGTREAPLRWEGRSSRKPWQYRVTASIPHLDTVAPLEVVIETLRAQSERPYILILDTGSPPDVCDRLERLRADDLEVHYIRSHGYIHSSAPVAVAMDLAFALCRSEFHYTTHADVFVKRRDWIAWLLSQCGPHCPAVGYEMSERSWATDQWRGMVSHTASLFHVPTIRRLGAVWSIEHAYELAGWTGRAANGWPDTETGFNLILRDKGVAPKLFAREENYQRYEDDNLVHVRSYSGRKIYGIHAETFAELEKQLQGDMAAARERIHHWRVLATR